MSQSGLSTPPSTSGYVGMDGSCSSSWGDGPAVPDDSPRGKATVGCRGPSPGPPVFSNSPYSMERPTEPGKSWVVPAAIHKAVHYKYNINVSQTCTHENETHEHMKICNLTQLNICLRQCQVPLRIFHRISLVISSWTLDRSKWQSSLFNYHYQVDSVM